MAGKGVDKANPQNNIYFGVCIDNNDPTRAGRIRLVADFENKSETPENYAAATYEASYKEKDYATVEEMYWTKDDPFLTLPLLPIHINVCPSNSDNVPIMFYQDDNKEQNRVYIGSTISQPHYLGGKDSLGEHYGSGRKGYSKGTRDEGKEAITNNEKSDGAFANPNTVSIDGKDNADIILGSREVVIRAGKFKPNKESPWFPTKNDDVTMLQLSSFLTAKEMEKTVEEVPEVEEAEIRYLVEYHIDDFTQVGAFNGNVKLWEVTPNEEIEDSRHLTSKDIGKSTNILSSWDTKPLVELSFNSQPISGVTYLVNKFINEANGSGPALSSRYLNSTPTVTPGWAKNGIGIDLSSSGSEAPADGPDLHNLHPFYYRPSLEFQKVIADNLTGYETAIDIEATIKGVVGVDDSFGLVFSPLNPEPQEKIKKVELEEAKDDPDKEQGVATLLSDKILFFAYPSKIASKGETNPTKESTTIYSESPYKTGIDQKTLIKTQDKHMEPLVRGEQLILLLEMMHKWMQGHSHHFPQGAPFDKPKEGNVTLSDIEEALGNARTEILNQNIRIN
jgi:hypothetical protein